MNKSVKLLRYIKRNILRLGIHRILPNKLLKKAGYTADLSAWITQRKEEIKFTSFPYSGFNSDLRTNLYEHIIEAEGLNSNIDYLEFGVAAGKSFLWWESKIDHPAARFNGFDTFTGLPEDWGHFKKGDMTSNNKKPEIDGDRHQFHQGLFQVTLPAFLKSFSSNRRKVIHLDADLFSSTLFVLTSLSPFIKKGDILIFDEFNVPNHEFQAFILWVESYYIEYTVLGEVNNFYQTAIRID